MFNKLFKNNIRSLLRTQQPLYDFHESADTSIPITGVVNWSVNSWWWQTDWSPQSLPYKNNEALQHNWWYTMIEHWILMLSLKKKCHRKAHSQVIVSGNIQLCDGDIFLRKHAKCETRLLAAEFTDRICSSLKRASIMKLMSYDSQTFQFTNDHSLL